jgi:hypothetical protein
MFPYNNSRIQSVPYCPDFHFILRETYLHLCLFKFPEYEMYTYIKRIAPGFECPLSGMFCFPGYLFVSFYTRIDFENVIAPKSAL